MLQAASASCLMSFAFGSSTAEPRFAAPFRSFAASGFDPHAVAVADFDRDGILDVAVAHSTGPISVHLGDGQGSLAPPIDSPGSSIALALAAVDADADGVTDLLTASGRYLFVSHGNGDGSFAAPNWVLVADCNEDLTCYEKIVTSFAVGDVDADGVLDAIVTVADLGSYDPGAFFVLRGTAAGSFSADAASYEVGAGVQSVVLADFDGDARLDVATANAYETNVSIRLGSGDGTFGVRNDFPTPNPPRWVDAGDFDGDGRVDLATVGDATAVLRGRGDGSFEPGTAMTPNGSTLAALDVNRDERLDLLVWSQGDAIAVLLGRGDASFDRAADVIAGAHPRALAAGDLDRDGILDLVAANRVSRTISVHHGNGNGTFGTHARFPAGQTPGGLVVADTNRDGNPDLIATNWNNATLSVWPGRGGGEFGPRCDFSTGNYPMSGSLALADVNHDGALDVVLSIQWHRVALLLGDGIGGFTAPLQIDTGWDPKSVGGGDVDGDGDADLVVAHRSGYSIHPGNDDGTFQPRVQNLFDEAIAGPLLLVDLNGDSRLDLVLSRHELTSPSDPLILLLGHGDGNFGPRTALPTDRRVGAIVAADVDGDGATDLVTADGNTSASLLLGNGDGSFQPAVHIAAERGASNVAVGELDGDGRTDLAIASSSANTVSILSGNGGTSFGVGVDFGAGRAPASLALADLNGDGTTDLATADAWSHTISLLWNLSDTVPVDVQEPRDEAATRLHLLYDPGSGTSVPIGFSLASPSTVRLAVYDARGALIRVLWRETLSAGRHTLDWDRRDRAGLSAPRAVYFVRLEAGRFVTSRKLVLLHRAP